MFFLEGKILHRKCGDNCFCDTTSNENRLLFSDTSSGFFCGMVLECIRKPQRACDQVAKVLFCVPVTLDLIPVFGGILIILADPGRDSNLRGVKPEPRKKIHEITSHMLHTIDMAHNDHGGDFIIDHPVPEP
jgi:hypothetical protein